MDKIFNNILTLDLVNDLIKIDYKATDIDYIEESFNTNTSISIDNIENKPSCVMTTKHADYHFDLIKREGNKLTFELNYIIA